MKKILLIILVFNIITYSQSGWFWQNPLPQGNDLLKVEIVNSNVIYALGSAGTVIKTTNAGQNWLDVSLGFSSLVVGIDFLNEKTGFIGTAFGTLLKTTNGGLTWENSYNAANETFEAIFVLDESNIYAAGSSTFYSTTNGGLNWISAPTGYYSTEISDLYFLNQNTGLLVGFPDIILKTTNAGLNWVNTVNFYITQKKYNSIEVTNNVVYVTGGYSYQNQVLRSSNFGDNWSCVVCSSTFYLGEIKFNNQGTGLILGSFLLKSTDYGNFWSQLPEININLYSPRAMDFKSNSSFIVGDYGMILKSSNSGNNWIEISDRSNLNWFNDVFYINSNTGFICGYGGKVYNTTNGGNKWDVKINDTSNVTFLNIKFLNNLGIVCGNSGRIFKTTDMGNTFNRIFTDSENNVYRELDIINMQSIVLCGNKVIRSDNGGINWNVISSPEGQKTSIDFINLNDGFIVVNGSIYKTTNGGTNWSLSESNNSSKTLIFFDGNIGIAAGINGSILRTTNSGISWQNINSGSSASFLKLTKIDSNAAFLLSNYEIFRTTDKGFSWTGIRTPRTSNHLWGISFLNLNTGTVVGYRGTIIKTTTGGEPIGIQPISNEVPQSFRLFQNYPNPFNPYTNIKFNIPYSEKTNTVLKIYDILGRVVSVLVNENLKPGEYEVQWDGSRFASGVYFYSLITDEFSETRKMVLIK